MKNIYLRFLPLLFAAVAFPSIEGKAQQQSAPTPQRDDSVTIHIKFIAPCVSPEKLKIWRYNVWEVLMSGDEVRSNNGQFTYRTAINGPQQFVLRLDKTHFDILTTPLEKNYEVEISCTGNQPNKMLLKDSYENQAFSQIYAVNKELYDTLEKVSNLNLPDNDRFPVVKKLITDYQDKVLSIAKNYSHSYTAQALCNTGMMPQSTLSSYDAFRDNYLQRQILADRSYYNCSFLARYVLHDYLFILNKNDTSFTGLNKALEIACNNPDAGKLFEEVLYNGLYNRRRERLLLDYMNWAKLNPNKMFNPQVKYKLSGLEKSMPGAPFIDLALKDTAGVERRLGETVASGKLTLLIFYSPTCSHCQETLPKIVPIWNQYKDKGFRIYAAGFDGTNAEWLNFMKTKGTAGWTNVFDNNYGRESSAKYSSNSTPTMILIDGQGKIITRFADVEYLQTEIPRLLGQ